MANWFTRAFRRIGEAIGVVSRETVEPSEAVSLAKRISRPDVKRRSLRRWPSRRAEIWDQLEDSLDDYLPQQSLDDYETKRVRLKTAYDMWSDPTQSKAVKQAAFERFWDDMGTLGFDIAEFDWTKFREEYPQ